jgi:hypothetical protein
MTTDTPRLLDVFFYGLFMDADLLRAKGLHPVNMHSGCVRDMAVRVGKRACLAASPGSVAHGIVMQLTHSELERLYAEPSVAMYKPEAVLVERADGGRVAALCFNLPTAPAPDEEDLGYVDALRDLRRRLGLVE